MDGNKKIGVIGCGTMAQIMVKGILNGGTVKPEEVLGSAPSEATRTKAETECGISTTPDNGEVAKAADLLMLGCKPYQIEQVIGGVRDLVNENQLIVSIAAGVTLESLARFFGRDDLKLVRLNPNTPCLVEEGVMVLCGNDNVTEEDMAYLFDLLKPLGYVTELAEDKLNASAAVSGCAPAYVYMFIEAMADAAVAYGIPRKTAYELVAQTVKGSGKMVQETGLQPGVLKDQVCSPSGTTIAGVRELEKNGFRGTVFAAIDGVMKRSAEAAK